MASMKKKNRSKASSDREKWRLIFNALKLMLRKQQSQLDSLVGERNFLEQRIKFLHDRWISDVRLSEDQISRMQRQISLSELSKSVDNAKRDLILGSKHREALLFQRKLENLETELNDFKVWFDILSHRCPNQQEQDISPSKLYERMKAKGGKDRSPSVSSMHHCMELEKEVAVLKREYEKLSLKSSSEVSALQAEINFVWNQYKEMESNYTKKLLSKNDEILQANEEVKKLLAGIEQLQSSIAEKDDSVETLRANITKLEGEASKKDGEIARLTKDLESLKSPGTAGLPVLKRCSSKPSSSSSTVRRNSRNRVSIVPEEEESSKQLQTNKVTELRAKITDLKAEANQKNGEIFSASKELQLLISKNDADTSELKHSKGEWSSSSSGKETRSNKMRATSPSEHVDGQGCRRSPRKRAAAATTPIDATPKLFTSQFKVPKLKSPSPLGR